MEKDTAEYTIHVHFNASLLPPFGIESSETERSVCMHSIAFSWNQKLFKHVIFIVQCYVQDVAFDSNSMFGWLSVTQSANIAPFFPILKYGCSVCFGFFSSSSLSVYFELFDKAKLFSLMEMWQIKDRHHNAKGAKWILFNAHMIAGYECSCV